jgi:hypothetical protein
LELPRMAPWEIGAGTHVVFTQTFCEIVGMESGKMWGYWQTWVKTIYIHTVYAHVCVYMSIHICADTYITLFCIALHYIASHPVTAH